MSRAEPLVYLVAGEASGDQLGAGLMQALRRAHGRDIAFAGVGGKRMAAEGLASLFPMADLSVMGLIEVLPRLRLLLRRIRETRRDIEARRPDIVVTIDAPSFACRVLRGLARRDAPRLHYVAPQLWAWRPGRIRTYRRVFDRLLALLPFEPAYFEARGLPCSFVGHPAAVARRGDAEAFRARHRLDRDVPILLVLPGSRRGEVGRLLPDFAHAVALLAEHGVGCAPVVLAAPGLEARIREATAGWKRPPPVVGDEEKADALAAASAAIAASGTVSIELAAARVPHLVAYRVNPITAWLVRRLIRVPHVNLVNLVLGRAAVPELLQERCAPHMIAGTVRRLLQDRGAAEEQRTALAEACGRLVAGGDDPSDRAAAAVLEALARAAKV